MKDIFTINYFLLFLTISIGLMMGRVRIHGISFDISGVIFVALILGHFGITFNPEIQTIGLLLFMVAIGLQAGPGFFDVFRKSERRLMLIPVLIILIGTALTMLLALIMKIEIPMAIGVFTGGFTSTPGLAAAIEATHSPQASLGYGIAYPFGVIGVILFVRLLPRLLRLDSEQAFADYMKEKSSRHPEIRNMNFVVQNPNVNGKTIGELGIRTMTGATISRVLHEGLATTPTPQTRLYVNDLIKVVGTAEALERIKVLIGPTTEQDIPLSKGYDVQWMVVTNKNVVNKTLAELNLLSNYNATVTRIRRNVVDITPHPHSTLRFGDKLMVAADVENMANVIKMLGNNAKRLSETDFLPIALGIVLGIILGRWSIPLFGHLSFHLGLTGGVLTMAILLSRLGKTGPIIWTLPGSGSQTLRQLGMLLFLACVGADAGAHFHESLSRYGLSLMLISLVITLLPPIITTVIAQRFMRINMLTLLGAIAGAMTSTPGLAAIECRSDCDAPQVAYAAVYPLALVLTILCTQFMARL